MTDGAKVAGHVGPGGDHSPGRVDMTPPGHDPAGVLGPLDSREDAMRWCKRIARWTLAGEIHPRRARKLRHRVRDWRLKRERGEAQ